MTLAADSVSVIPATSTLRDSLRGRVDARESESVHPGPASVRSAGPLLDAFEAAATTYAERTFLRMKQGDAWRAVSYGAFRADARRIASWLVENGIVRGSTIAL